MSKINCRSVWISDVHLGTKGCQATSLVEFLKSYRCENLFLVGDIIDGWRIASKKWYWPSDHNRVVRQILRKSEKEGTNVFYITGNHDEFLRDYIAEHNFVMGNVKVLDEVYYETLKGEKVWVVHGDAFDCVTRHHRWVALIGDTGYHFLLWSNTWVNALRRLLKLPYWSLSKAIKRKVKGAVNFIFEFEKSVVKEAKKRKVDGVICGHIHHAEKKVLNGINYYNCGDWVESCSALIEDAHGNISVTFWNGEVKNSNVVPIGARQPKQGVG